MDDQLRQESLESFHHLLSNVRMDRLCTGSNNSKDEMNLLNDLLEIRHNENELFENRDFRSHINPKEFLADFNTAEMYAKAFKVEIELHSEPFMIFTRNNGIVSKTKKSNKALQGLYMSRKEGGYNDLSAQDTEENYLSLPVREKSTLNFTLQPQNFNNNELSNFESLGNPKNAAAAQKDDLLTFSSYQNTLEKENLQENVPFLLRHPANRSSGIRDSKVSNKALPEIIERAVHQQEIKIHEMSFNKDLLNSTNRTIEQDTARSLRAAGPYELTEEEDINTSNKYEDTFERAAAISQDRLQEVRNEVINLKQNEQQQAGKPENRIAASENYIISLFYQIVNENKLLKQETQHLHERIDDLIKNKQSESEIIINLQQNLEMTMMLMKRRDDEFSRLQKQHEELSKKFDSYVATQASKITYDNYLHQQPSKSNSFMVYPDVQDEEVPIPVQNNSSTNRTSRRSSSYNNPPGSAAAAAQQQRQTNRVDPRFSRQASIENQQQQQQQVSHRMMFPPQNTNNVFSAMENDMVQNSFIENRRGSGYNLRAQTAQTQERHESGFDTYGDHETGYLPLTEPNSLFFNQGKVQQNQARRPQEIMYNKGQQQQRKENSNNTSVRIDYSREREKGDMKENIRWKQQQQGSSSRSPNTSQSNFNGGWMGMNSTPKVTPDPIHDSKVKSKGQNYKKYSDLFRKQKEMSEIGNNFLKEEIKGKIQRK